MRLGYNVLIVDSDAIIYDDPYKYFKAEPFKVRSVMVWLSRPMRTIEMREAYNIFRDAVDEHGEILNIAF